MKLPEITPKQQEIIRLLFRFRFLNRIQIQTMLLNKDHHNINAWLKDLHQKQYIGRLYDSTYKQNTIPAKYYLTVNGIRFLRTIEHIDQSILKKYYQEKRRSHGFISKSLLVADIFLKLNNVEKLQQGNLKYYTQQDFPPDAEIRDLLPDFAYVFTVKRHLEHVAGEIFSDSMPRYAIRGRVEKYIEYFSNEEGRPTSVVFICSKELTCEYIGRFLKRYFREEPGINANFYLATYSDINEKGMEIELFKKANID